MRIFAVTLFLLAAPVEAQFIQQGAKLRGQGGRAAELGSALALSADGNTAIAGAPESQSQIGGAWIFTRNGKVWSQQGPKLVGSGGSDNARQGSSVAISADGNTALIGGRSDNGSAGAAWVFTRSGETWMQQGAKLVGALASGSSAQGFAVALSGDGNTAIVGGPSGTDGGAVWIFTRSSGVWTQQGSKLIGIGGFGGPGNQVQHGWSVALSYDGNTAIVGGPGDQSEVGTNPGAAWVYVRAAGVWSQQGGKLVGDSPNVHGKQGTSVSLSANGNTAVSGGYLNHPQGAVWVFTRSDLGVWSQQGAKLVGSDANGSFTPPLQGRAVAISGDATTIVEAGSGDTSLTGSVWPFAKAVPTIATNSGNGESAQVSATFAPLSVIVRDAADQPSSNVPVTFAIHTGPSGAGGTFASSATVLTNAGGIATAPTLTANTTIGGFTVTAMTASAPASAIFNLTNAALPAPTNVATNTTPQLWIAVNWTASNGATLYEVQHAVDGVTYTSRTTTSETSFVDSSGIGPNSGYLYRVRAIEPGLSSFSTPAVATVMSFIDPGLTTGTRVKATHFMELRQAVRIVRALAGLDEYSYTDPNLQGERVKAIHLTQLRIALDEARARLMLPAVLYTRPMITPGSTQIKAVDVLDLRNGAQ